MKKNKLEQEMPISPGSRRQFLLYLGALPLIYPSYSAILNSVVEKADEDNEDLILLDGWIIKKGDLYDL